MSLRFITSASSSTSVVVGSGRASTRAAMNGSVPSNDDTVTRVTPCRITLKLSLASLMTLRMRAAQPTRYMSSSPGSSVRASFCVRMPMTGRSLEMASSTKRTDFRRPTSMGMMLPGKRTEFLSGRMGMTSGISTGSSPPDFGLVMKWNVRTRRAPVNWDRRICVVR
jgi:hypothetical protein